MQYGYARVSTAHQDTALQQAAFKRAGIRRVIEEKKSGGNGSQRPLLDALLASLRPGDCLVVYKIDRLARSLSDLLRILGRVRECGAHFRSLTEPIEASTPIGELLLHVLGAIAQFERSMIRERCITGMNEARARGVVWGRRRKVPVADVVALISAGVSFREAACRLGLNKTTVRRSWRQHLGLPV